MGDIPSKFLSGRLPRQTALMKQRRQTGRQELSRKYREKGLVQG